MTTECLIFAVAVSLAAFTQSSVGFAGGLVAMPILVQYFPPDVSVPAYSLSALALQVVTVIESRKHLRWEMVGWLAVGGLAGVPVGIQVLMHVSPTAISLIISMVSLLLAIALMLRPIRLGPGRDIQIGTGVISGVLGGMMGTSGPPVVLYGMARGWEKDAFRTTMLTYFSILGIEANITYAWSGLHSTRTLILVACGVLPGLLLTILGIHVKNRFSEAIFRWAVLAVISVVSLVGIGKYLLR